MLLERSPQAVATPARERFGVLKAMARELRPLHWLKNGFVFAPLLFSRSFHDPAAVAAALWAALVFSIVSSAVYVWNDLLDAGHDRLHPAKRHRPIASGALSARSARWLIAGLLLLGTLLAAFRIPAIGPHIAAYVLLNLAYSARLKRIPWLDLAILSAGFALRVDAGAVAVAVQPSGWMTVATVALAVYLASLKRFAELAALGSQTRRSLAFYDAGHLRAVAIVSGTVAVGCYALFATVARPALLFTLLPVLLGVARYGWLVLHRDGSDSPFLLIARDPILLASTLLWGVGILIGLW